nr:sensor histidine kinase [Rhizobium sp. ACO-34A]
MLSRLEGDDRATFRQFIDSELAAAVDFGNWRALITLKGPSDVFLRSSMVQILALAIHELFTNALKYGAP